MTRSATLRTQTPRSLAPGSLAPGSPAPASRARRGRAPLLSAALLSAALLTGCSQGSDAFNENFPADEANPAGDAREVPRLPVAPQGVDDDEPEIVVTREPEPPVASQEDAGRG